MRFIFRTRPLPGRRWWSPVRIQSSPCTEPSTGVRIGRGSRRLRSRDRSATELFTGGQQSVLNGHIASRGMALLLLLVIEVRAADHRRRVLTYGHPCLRRGTSAEIDRPPRPPHLLHPPPP